MQLELIQYLVEMCELLLFSDIPIASGRVAFARDEQTAVSLL